jgi:DNA-binding response OmpR family regulator
MALALPKETALSAQTAGSTILVVEDDETIRESIVELMMEEGFEVAAAENGSAGIAYLRNAGKLPDLILLDLMMPVMDGFEFCTVKNREPHWAAIPTVVMSADGHVVEKKLKTGASDYIQKPLDIDDLIARVTQFLPATP